MLGILLSAFAAVTEATKDILAKLRLKDTDPLTLAWGLHLTAIPALLIFLLFSGMPDISPTVWSWFIIVGILDALASYLLFKGVKLTDISLSMPLISFTPLFILFVSPFMVNEFPSALGIIGVILIVIGSYLLHVKKLRKGVLVPLKALIDNLGTRYVLIVAFLWSITSNIDKIGVQGSSPVLWALGVNMIVAIFLTPFAFRRGKLKKHLVAAWPLGTLLALIMFFQFWAIQLTLVAYVISIKRLSTVIDVVVGGKILKESGLKERLLGTIIMLVGGVIIMLA